MVIAPMALNAKIASSSPTTPMRFLSSIRFTQPFPDRFHCEAIEFARKDEPHGSRLSFKCQQIARQHLEAAMASERILSELPLLRSSYVKTQVERLKIRPKARALQYARYLKKNYPDEFAPYEEEAKTIIEGLSK